MTRLVQIPGTLAFCLTAGAPACSDTDGDPVQDARVDAAGDDGQVTPSDDGGEVLTDDGCKFHMTADISVVHAPDFTRWYWIELGDPYYEDSPP